MTLCRQLPPTLARSPIFSAVAQPSSRKFRHFAQSHSSNNVGSIAGPQLLQSLANDCENLILSTTTCLRSKILISDRSGEEGYKYSTQPTIVICNNQNITQIRVPAAQLRVCVCLHQSSPLRYANARSRQEIQFFPLPVWTKFKTSDQHETNFSSFYRTIFLVKTQARSLSCPFA